MLRFLVVVIVLLITLTAPLQAKHHSCAASDDPCPVYKHKICGSDGKLYPSRCHLRRASCLKNVSIRPAHPDACEQDEDESNEDNNNDENEAGNQSNNINNKLEASIPVEGDDDNSDVSDYSDEDQCQPKEYDLMKETVLAKVPDIGRLFSRLDENDDGVITLNELWRHSSLYQSADYNCLLTDMMQHEDSNQDHRLDRAELQQAFNKLYSVTMVTLDESLAVNRIEAHLGDNVEIRCDIGGEPQKPAIKWYRHGVNLSSLNLPYIKVFSDGSLYLTDLQLTFAGNYTCQAANNPTVKQTHIVHVIVNPIVEVSPRFQWAPIGGVVNFECRFETFDDHYEVTWYKNEQQLIDGRQPRLAILNNGTELMLTALEPTDTGAFTCRVRHKNGAAGQSMATLLVQEDTVQSKTSQEHQPQKLWIFHATGVTILQGVCGQTLHEIDARDIIVGNVQLCGAFNVEDNKQQPAMTRCEWSQDVVVIDGHLYIGQPNLNRLVVFNIEQLNIVSIIQTDAQPKRLWSKKVDGRENQIWVLCDGNTNYYDEKMVRDSSQDDVDFEWRESLSADRDSSIDVSKYDYLNDKYLRNRKTIQVVRLPSNESQQLHHQHHQEVKHRVRRQADVVHLQPVDGHFDLVYDLFMPPRYESIFKEESTIKMNDLIKESIYAYATHWEERSLVKISIPKMEYTHSIRLADCQPISVTIIDRRAGGLVAVFCQTPITHRLNGQLILDQATDAILAHNTHLNAHQAYLSPDQRYLVGIMHEHSNNITCLDRTQEKCVRAYNTSTILVQRITETGVEFMYDVRTSLDIVECRFVWRNGRYDFVMASGTPNREDLLYLFLEDGHVELISGVGRPTEGYHRSMAMSNKNQVLSVTSTESIYTVDMSTNKILCESIKHFKKPQTLLWVD